VRFVQHIKYADRAKNDSVDTQNRKVYVSILLFVLVFCLGFGIISLQRNNRIRVLNRPQPVLPHTLLQEDLTLTARLGRKNVNVTHSPHTQRCTTQLGNIPQTLNNCPLSMNRLITIPTSLAPCPHTILCSRKNLPTLRNHRNMKKGVVRTTILTRINRKQRIIHQSAKKSRRHFE
jgi:hypothetical protein